MFFIRCARRTATTLFQAIRKCIHPGTTINSHPWKAYDNIATISGMNYTVNYSKKFMNSSKATHTNSVKRMWLQAEKRNKRECVMKRTELDSYLCEFMWRQIN